MVKTNRWLRFRRRSALETDFEPRKMVGWYSPRVLAQSAWLVAVSNLFGRHSDSRLIEALAGQKQDEFDYSDCNSEFWLDFVCDTGDGWNSTYAVAKALAADTLEVAQPDGSRVLTKCGSVLVFGGDEVYPYPSRAEYEARTEVPYDTAFAIRTRRPDVFAVPGNHDWYDSLVAFSRMFCRPERGFAGCNTRQTRSYFALKLPQNWWLVAIDLQLGADLDEPQVQYFQSVAERMAPEAKLILCVPEPRWILEDAYPDHASYEEESAIRFLEERIFQRKAWMFLTGDLHFYKRHSNAEGVHKVTSGGGGGFMHPTHAPFTPELRNGFVQRAVFPDEATSRRLAWKNILFPILNPEFFLLPAVIYALSAWLASASLHASQLVDIPTAALATVHAAIRDPFDGLWLLGIITGFVFFTDTHVLWWRFVGGILHALMHLTAAFFVGWFAYQVTVFGFGFEFDTIPQLLISGAITFGVGGVVGSVLVGVYLLLSVQVFGRHSNEAFSSLKIADYKQWLRLRIAPDGKLTVFSIGMDRVPRRWQRVEKNGIAALDSADERATPPRLIDSFECK
jgi:hypothetical protein